MPFAIRVENLSKRYRIRHASERLPYRTLRDDLVRVATAPVRWLRRSGTGSSVEDFWALRDVGFDVQPGEVLGIIGRNGAGKSTLLKILSRITKPTSGCVRLRGRVGSLLEVGTGFHPELSGRENIYLSGAVLGMRRSEIQRKFDEIVAFAEIEQFLDTPAKRYSSGMYVRLGFAVAAHLDPEILLIDEVLAVGDAAFRRKCVGKMGEVAGEGRTVLLVSHDMQAVANLASRCCVLSRGRCVFDGVTAEAITAYLRETKNETPTYTGVPDPHEPRLTYVGLKTSAPGNTQHNGEPMEVHLEITTPVAVDGASVSFQFCNALGQPIVHLWSFDSERPFCRAPGTYHLVCRIPRARLYLGYYTLTVHLAQRCGGRAFEKLSGICPFEMVIHRDREYPWVPGTCTYLEDADWCVHPASSPPIAAPDSDGRISR
jgi:lipopolysaccharide transport system ATP-binding protein